MDEKRQPYREKNLSFKVLYSQVKDCNICVVAGRPAIGKTALAINFGKYVTSELKENVVYFSFEDSEKELTERFGTLLNFYFDDTGENIEDVIKKCKGLKTANKLNVVIIDKLQSLLRKYCMPQNYVALTYSTLKSLKKLSEEISAPIIILSHLQGSMEKNKDKRPQMKHLREMGVPAEDVDTILFLYRENYYYAEPREGIFLECNILKSRNNIKAKIKLEYDDLPEIGFADSYGKKAVEAIVGSKTKELQELYSEYTCMECFTLGGIIDEMAFENSKERILVIFALPNDSESHRENHTLNCGRKIYYNKNSDEAHKIPRLWKNLSRWALITENENLSFKETESDEFCEKLRKGLGILAVTDLRKIIMLCSNYVHSKEIDKETLIEEINIIDPRIVICCDDVSIIIKELFKNETKKFKTKSGIKYFKLHGRIYFETCHPGETFGNRKMFEYFKTFYKEINFDRHGGQMCFLNR